VSTPATQVETSHGTVRGTTTPAGLRAFRAIPYAAPPVGNLRFRAPRPAQPWTGVRNAMHHGPVAPQRVTQAYTGAGPDTEQSEDCLTLNVIAPATTSETPRPVIVWFHGGAFSHGSASAPAYAGDVLVERGDVLVVTVTYRLGALGVLDFSEFSTPTRTFESNLGLRDQVAALEWVQQNIAAFGGDPDNVTIAGQSAGGTSVTTLMCVPSAAGLFHRAIAQSPALGAAYGQERAAGWARDLITWLQTTESLAVDALLSAPPAELVSAGARLTALSHREAPGALCMSPVVDGDFLPEHPTDAFAAGRAHQVPLLVGSTKHEGAAFGAHGSLLPTGSEAINLMFEITDPGAQLTVLSAYPGYPSHRARAQLVGDATFWVPAVQAAQHHSRTSPTFVYRYDFTTPILNLQGQGASHGTDMLAVLGSLDSSRARAATLLGGSDELAALSERMQDHWLTFARTGDAGWPAYDADDRPTKIFAAHDRVISDPGRERRRAWEGVARYR
jgi:para-nitrobenzyl esterase